VAVIVPFPRTCSCKMSVHVVVLCSVGTMYLYSTNMRGAVVAVIVPLPRTCSCKVSGPPRVFRIQLHCTDTLQLQVLGSCTITATTAPIVFVEYNYIVPTPYSCRFLGVVQLYSTNTRGAVVDVIVLLPRTCSCKVSVQCSCILQTRGGPSWP
jgi:hypothetical protein